MSIVIMRTWAFALATCLAGSLAAAGAEPDPITVVSFNLRFDTPSDGPDAWPHRAYAVASLLRSQDADIIGVQEPLHHQLLGLDTMLPHHTWSGAGREDGRIGGEFCAIFFRRDRFYLIDQGTMWLSTRPLQRGSRSWRTLFPRIMVWVKLRDRESGQEFFVLNTHLDNRRSRARVRSARLIVEFVNEKTGGLPVIMTGDFNSRPHSPTMQTLTLAPSPLRDAKDRSEKPHRGPLSTWNGFREVAPNRRIDYILVTGHFNVHRHAILDERVNGRFLSDHLPVIATVSKVASSRAATSPDSSP
jgi:endonuclease/exonuclease/phosphatase family metal-dependent hydrolase